VVEALTHPSRRVRRLMDMAVTWADTVPDNVPIPAQTYRIMRQLRPAEIDDLVKAYAGGASVYELAKQFGIHRSTVGQHLRARGVDTTPIPLQPDEVVEAAELYRSGWSLARIGGKFDVAASTVRNYLLAAGVATREQRGGRKPKTAS
jgi:DNA-binding transcriptional ArsR family regulator